MQSYKSKYRTVASLNEVRGLAYQISLIECLDHAWCISKLFRWLQTLVRGVVKPFPLNKIEQPCALGMVVKLAVEDLTDFPLVGVIQLNWWRWVDHSVGYLTRASGLQQ